MHALTQPCLFTRKGAWVSNGSPVQAVRENPTHKAQSPKLRRIRPATVSHTPMHIRRRGEDYSNGHFLTTLSLMLRYARRTCVTSVLKEAGSRALGCEREGGSFFFIHTPHESLESGGRNPRRIRQLVCLPRLVRGRQVHGA